MSEPLAVQPDTFTDLPLGSLADELLASPEFEREGHTARTLIKSSALTVVMIALAKGRDITEHTAPGPALVTPLRGRLHVTHGSERLPVAEGSSAALMGPGLRHAVQAEDDSIFLLVLGTQTAHGR